MNQRLDFIDALRGFALMGLFLIHMIEYFELYWYKPEASPVHDIVFFLFSGKAYTIFAFLFGLSFSIILNRWMQRDGYFVGRFSWRLTLLLLIGIAHQALYGGDILQNLAVGGFILLLIHRLPTMVLVAISACLLLQIPTWIRVLWLDAHPEYAQGNPEFWQLMYEHFKLYAYSPMIDIAKHNLTAGYYTKWMFGFETGHHWNLTGAIIAGFVCGRLGVFEAPTQRKKRFAIWLMGSLILLGIVWVIQNHYQPELRDDLSLQTYTQIMRRYFSLAMVGCYVSGLSLLFCWSSWRRWFVLFAPTGRMTLTFYIGQSLVFIPIFYGYGFGLYDKTNQATAISLGLIAWSIQMWFAHWWMARFHYGPLEWLWRAGTFMNLNVPFRKT